MFIDRVNIELLAGKGGDGAVAWRREKYIPKGGPTGGNGGKGGSVILRTTQVPSLENLRNRRRLKADNGQPGGASQRSGRNGKDLIIEIPVGTVVKDSETEEVLHDFTLEGEEWTICKGGKGGKGNDHFKSPTNRAPNQYTPGLPGEERRIELELKLIADVGLVGFPNAGKSTLIKALADVEVKIAPYPFTTLRPNIGFIETEKGRIFIADIPGIIEGANQNRGLGIEFLRHIERTSLLLFVLDASGIDGRTPTDDYRVLRDELKAYNPELLKRQSIAILNKIDTEESIDLIKAFKKHYKTPVLEISALTGMHLDLLQKEIIAKLAR